MKRYNVGKLNCQDSTSVRDALISAAQLFLTSFISDSLEQPLLAHQNATYNKWINTCKHEDLVAFRRARGEAKRAVREAKNRWFHYPEL